MNEQSQAAAVAESFADRVRAFHQDLPVEEQRLLEQVFALATIAASDGQDTKGHGADFLLMIDGFQHKGGINGFSWGATQQGAMR